MVNTVTSLDVAGWSPLLGTIDLNDGLTVDESFHRKEQVLYSSSDVSRKRFFSALYACGMIWRLHTRLAIATSPLIRGFNVSR